MDFSKGEILISPKTIHWIQIPSSIAEDDKVELLKKDILLISHNGNVEDILKLKEKDTKDSAFFYNLDGILSTNRIKGELVYDFSNKIAKFITSFFSNKSLVYTTVLDENLAKLFRNEGIVYFEKNLNDKKLAISTILSIIEPFFSENNTIKRSFLRLNLLPMKYKVTISNLSNYSIVINAFLKDLSLNGMCLVFPDNNDINSFTLKDIIELKVFVNNSILKISKAIVTRVDKTKFEIGINYNINDSKMIREDYASYLIGIIYDWIKEIVHEYGRLT